MCACSVMPNPFGTPWNGVRHTSPSMDFPRQEYWSQLPFLPPRDLPDPGIKHVSLISPALAGRFFTALPPGKHINKLKPAPNALEHRRNDIQLRKWQPTAVFLPGKSHGQRNLAGYSPWCRKESDRIEQLTHTTWGNQQKYHGHNRCEFDTINDEEDTQLGSPAGTDAQWHPSQWYLQGSTLSWDGDRAGYVEEGWGLPTIETEKSRLSPDQDKRL